MAQIMQAGSRLAHASTGIRSMGIRFMGTVTVPDLDYDYAELEPVICAEIMELHHKKHHATYVNGLNAALEQQANLDAKGDLAGLIKLQPTLKFNGGGE